MCASPFPVLFVFFGEHSFFLIILISFPPILSFKMTNTFSYQWSKTYNCIEIQSHPDQKAYYWENKQKVLMGMHRCRVREGTLIHCWWDCRLVKPLWRQVWMWIGGIWYVSSGVLLRSEEEWSHIIFRETGRQEMILLSWEPRLRQALHIFSHM